jgi:hypothetical protein
MYCLSFIVSFFHWNLLELLLINEPSVVEEMDEDKLKSQPDDGVVGVDAPLLVFKVSEVVWLVVCSVWHCFVIFIILCRIYELLWFWLRFCAFYKDFQRFSDPHINY